MFSLVIPVYNEEASVKNVLSEYIRQLQALPYPYEVIVVDDHSTDNTAQLLHTMPVHVVRNVTNLGYGNSIKNGLLKASYDNIIITDCDDTYPAALLPQLCSLYLQNEGMAVCARTGPNINRTFKEKCARFFLRKIVETAVGRSVVDVNSGYRVFNRRQILDYLDEMSNGYSFTTSLTIIYAYTGAPIVYLPFEYGLRTGKSKVNYLKDALRTYQRIMHLVYYFKIKQKLQQNL